MGVVIFSSPRTTAISAEKQALELMDIGAKVLLVENGITRGIHEKSSNYEHIDELFAPILDVTPGQLFADALANQLNIAPDFRYIQKVVISL